MTKKGIKRYYVGGSLHKEVKKTISGKNEIPIRSLIESLGYVEGEHFIWQYILLDGIIVDFAFPNEMVCIEADGVEHSIVKNKKKDNDRDLKISEEGWVIIRIDTTNLNSYYLSFYRNLIKEVLKDRSNNF